MRKIAVITGSRAEYGLLYPLLKELKNDQGLCLQLIVTGMHLSKTFGLTYREIEKDGFHIDKKIPILTASDSPTDISKSMSLALMGFSKTYAGLKPDIVVVLGDRFEIFSAVSAAMVARIPVAHIGGGDSSEGVIDEAMRHAITKMSHLHFTITEAHRQRVIQLGEDPSRVFNLGAPGLENIRHLKLMKKNALEKTIGFQFGKRNLMVTFHPCTLENATAGNQFKNLLNVLDGFKDLRAIFTKPNADTNGRVIMKMIDSYVRKNKKRATAYASMGRLQYLSALQFVDGVMGNSSSGIIEAPTFKIGTINIGERQRGRLKTASVIDCRPTSESIHKALEKLYSPKFRQVLQRVKNPYEKRNTAKNIKRILKNFNFKDILKKDFLDLPLNVHGHA